MIEYVKNFQYNGILGIVLYWVPLLFCLYGYFIRTWNNYRKDVDKRENGTYYTPTDTLGTLIGRAIITLLPFSNFCAAIFDLAPEVFGRLFNWLGHLFDIPLVPDSDSFAEKRKNRK